MKKSLIVEFIILIAWALIVLSIVYGVTGCNDEEDPCVDYIENSIPLDNIYASWEASTEGSKPKYYVIQLSTNGNPYKTIGTAQDTFYIFNTLDYCNTYRCRVYAVDHMGREGDVSLPSKPYKPIPGETGTKSMKI